MHLSCHLVAQVALSMSWELIKVILGWFLPENPLKKTQLGENLKAVLGTCLTIKHFH